MYVYIVFEILPKLTQGGDYSVTWVIEYKDSDILFVLVTLKEENGIVKVVYSLIVTFLSLGFKGTKT